MRCMLAAIPFRTFPSVSIGPLTIRTFGVFVGSTRSIQSVATATRG